MATEPTEPAEPMTDTDQAEDQDWGTIGLAVGVSVLAALAVHYGLVATVDLHPTLHALVGIALFFVAGLVMFKVVLF